MLEYHQVYKNQYFVLRHLCPRGTNTKRRIESLPQADSPPPVPDSFVADELESRNHNRTPSNGARSLSTLPIDVVQYLFQFCLPRADNIKDFKLHRDEPPLQLAQVCSSWRRFALLTPELWSIIVLRTPRDLPFVRQCAKRIGPGIPLSIFYNAGQHGLLFDLNKVCKQSKRLHVTINTARHSTNLVSNPFFKSLEELCITVLAHRGDKVDPLTDIPYGNAPRLRKLELDLLSNFTRSSSRLQSMFPWSQLTNLRISPIIWACLAPLLSLCVNLQEGSFCLDLTDAPSEESTTQMVEEWIPLHDIRSLSLTCNQLFYPGIFNGLLFSNIQSLSIVRKDYRGLPWRFAEPAWIDDARFFNQLSNLQSLTLCELSGDISSVIHHTPQLRTLRVSTHHWETSRRLLQLLTHRMDDQEGNVLLLLTYLRLEPLNHSAPSDKELIELVKSRLAPNLLPGYLPLEVFEYHSCTRDMREVLEKAFGEEENLKIIIYDHWYWTDKWAGDLGLLGELNSDVGQLT